MSGHLSFEMDWKTLERGAPEVRAGFAAFAIRCNTVYFTQAVDMFSGTGNTVHVSVYPLAEWLAWNWWRLRWEAFGNSPNWALAHRLATVGGGYVWPNITIGSDGERVTLWAKPTRSNPKESLQYLTDSVAAIPVDVFETSVDAFIKRVLDQMRAKELADTNLGRIWLDLCEERHDPTVAVFRKFEALLGCDPGEGDEDRIQALLADSQDWGERAVSEIAASQQRALTGDYLREIATVGADANPQNAIRLLTKPATLSSGPLPAWKRGVEAARMLRRQEQLGEDPVSNVQLAELAGVSHTVFSESTRRPDISFALDRTDTDGKILLRPKQPTGQRFDLARLLGDRLLNGTGDDRLFPVTRSRTYRQKAQRAFAAELLCPFEVVAAMLPGDDISDEGIEEIAQHFAVSPLAVRTLLVNHDRLPRAELPDDVAVAA